MNHSPKTRAPRFRRRRGCGRPRRRATRAMARGRARGGNKRDIVRARNRGDQERHTDIRTSAVRVRPRRNRTSPTRRSAAARRARRRVRGGTRQTTTNDDARCHMFPVATTASVPASMRWPSVAEARVCEDAHEGVDRAARDARARAQEAGTAPPRPAERSGGRTRESTECLTPKPRRRRAAAEPADDRGRSRAAAAAGEDEAFFDDEYYNKSSSEDEGPEEEEGGGGGAGIRRRRRRRRRRRTGVAIEIRPGRANAQSRHAVAFAPPDAGEGGARVPCVHAR